MSLTVEEIKKAIAFYTAQLEGQVRWAVEEHDFYEKTKDARLLVLDNVRAATAGNLFRLRRDLIELRLMLRELHEPPAGRAPGPGTYPVRSE